MKSVVPFSDKDEFIQSHFRLVHYVARKLQKKALANHIEYDDLYGSGCIGLVKAYNKFDPERGLQFSTYAVRTIYGEVQNYIRDSGIPISVPRPEYMLANKIRQFEMESNPPSLIAEFFLCDKALVERTLESMQLVIASMDGPLTSDMDCTLHDMVLDHEDFSSVYVSDFLLSLTERDRTVIDFRMNGSSQAEIGQVVGVSQGQIWRDLEQIRKKLLKAI